MRFCEKRLMEKQSELFFIGFPKWILVCLWMSSDKLTHKMEYEYEPFVL